MTADAPSSPPTDEDLEDLYQHAPCGYLSTTMDGTIVRANATLLGWLDRQACEVVDRLRFSDLLTVGGRMYVETHWTPMLLLQGHVREVAFDMRRADGSVIPVLVTSRVVVDASETPVLIRTSIFDATERRAYERELLHARDRALRSEERARVLAETLQASLMPPATPSIPGLEVAATYRPAGTGDEVGGDFYDVFEIGGREWVVVLGDVTGKGAQAAVVTALARHTMRSAAMRSGRPTDVLGELNAALMAQQDGRYCTVVCLHLRRDTGGRVWVTVASGGHPLPLLIDDTAEGVTISPVGLHGTMLGVVDSPALHQTTIMLRPGQRLFCYSDGFIEGRSRPEDGGLGTFYGDDRLLEALRRHGSRPAEEMVRTLTEEVVDFQEGLTKDDMAAVVVGLERTGGR